MPKRIDCGGFSVWSYQRPHLHTRERRRMEGPMMTEWAYCLQAPDGSFQISRAVSRFATEAEALAAGRAAAGPGMVVWRCKQCGRDGTGETCSVCDGSMGVAVAYG